jgi:hypothetical protein
MLQYTIIRHLRENKGSKYSSADSSDYEYWAQRRFKLRRTLLGVRVPLSSTVLAVAKISQLVTGGGDFCFRLPSPCPRAVNFKVVES